MKRRKDKRLLFFTIVLFLAVVLQPNADELAPGAPAPDFTAADLNGRSHHLESLKDRPMVVLYFFDPEDPISRENLASLSRLLSQYKETRMAVWAITTASRSTTKRFVQKSRIPFPVLLDDGDVSRRYGAETVLPTACVLGPGLKILDFVQGGGKAAENILVRLAERQLQRKQVQLAKALSREVMKKDPGNFKALQVEAYAALKEGRLDEAEALFKKLEKKGGRARIVAKEGLAAVYAKKGKTEEALKIADQVEKEAPQRAFAHVTKGNILLSQNKIHQAEQEFKTAAKLPEAEPFQRAVPFNQLGRIYARRGKYAKARELYDQAIDVDPYFVEATSNKGLTYQKQSEWNQALQTYQQALRIDPKDVYLIALARKAEEMVKLSQERARKERLDRLVKELAERYRKGKWRIRGPSDEWTSRPMILTFVDVQEKGLHPERDGFSEVLIGQLTALLNASKRVQVVERVLIERLIEELNLGSSELADPETALKLGRILACKLVGTGSVLFLPQGAYLNLRLIDSETTAIPLVIGRSIDTDLKLEEELYALNREILRSVIESYPLRGYIVSVDGDEVLINIGSRHGVVVGTVFNVLEDQKPISYKGRRLRRPPKTVGKIRITRVEEDLAYGKVVSKKKSFRADMKIEEKADLTLSERS